MNATRPAFDAALFEQHVQKASRPSPPIRPELQSFIERYSPGTPFRVAEQDGFDWKTGEILLTRSTARGKGMRSYVTVAHEVAHSHQRRDWPWIPSWAVRLPGINLWMENNAFHRSLSFLTP